MTTIVTYVEMTDLSQLNPGTVVPELALTTADRNLSLVADIMARIGAPYGWRSSRRSPQEWQAWFDGHPGRTCRLLTLDDEPGIGVGFKVGMRVPGVATVATVRGHGEKMFIAVHGDTPRGVRVHLGGAPWDEWVVGCADPEAVAATLASAS